MPGLFDMHVRRSWPRRVRGQDGLVWEQLEETGTCTVLNAKRLLPAGFTKVRETGCRGRIVMAARDVERIRMVMKEGVVDKDIPETAKVAVHA